MVWFIWAICASLCAAALAESNRIFKLDPQMLNAWRATIAAALLACAIPYMSWSESSDFYLVALLDGFVTAIGMMMFFKLAAKQSGRISSMILPLAAIGSYFTWWLVYPELRPTLDHTPYKVILAVLSTTLIFVAIQKVRDNDASVQSFTIVFPVGFAMGVVNALTKSVMGDAYNIYAYALAYAFLALVTCAVASWIVAIPRPPGGRPYSFFSRKLLWGSFWCAFWTAGMVLSTVFSLSLAPHPSLPGLFLALTPVWLLILNHFKRVYDDASVPASILILAGATGLVLSTL